MLEALVSARKIRRADLLDEMTHVENGRPDVHRGRQRATPAQARAGEVEKAFASYLDTIPRSKRFDRGLFYDLRDVVGKSGLRHRQRRAAGVQPAGRGLHPGARQRRRALDEAGQRARAEPVQSTARPWTGTSSTRATAPWSASVRCRCTPTRCWGTPRWTASGYVVSEVSPYEVDLDWENITEPDEMAAVVDLLGRATAKVHCACDEDSDQDLVEFQVEAAIVASLKGRRRDFDRPRRRLRPVVRRDRAQGPRPVRRCLPQRTVGVAAT